MKLLKKNKKFYNSAKNTGRKVKNMAFNEHREICHKTSRAIMLRNIDQSQRQLKFANVIKLAIIECLKKEGSIDIMLENCPVTFTNILMTKDLRIAYCYFLPFNTKLSFEEIYVALNNSKNIIRNFVNSKIHSKYSPELIFYYDITAEEAAKINYSLENL